MQKVIKIFLGSSLIEFDQERCLIENFLYRISRDFEKKYNISVVPLLCENFDDAYSTIRKQEEYNEKVRESDMSVFIFFTKVGQYTQEEFEVARKKFEETGKPRIYTYVKAISKGTIEQSVQNFMDELDQIYGHYCGIFEHIDTVKLRILLNLMLQELNVAEIKVEADKCLVDGKEVLSLKNVSEFANNGMLKELTEELTEVEKKYLSLKAKYETGTCTYKEEREYIEIATKRQTLMDSIEELRKNIFNMSLRMCQDEVRGEITLRQKEAYRLFEEGDLEGANSILDFAEIKNEYMRRKAIRVAEQKKDAQIFIRESRTKIEILTVMNSLSTRFDEIEEIYCEITEIAFEENVELDVVFDFAKFLYEQNKDIKAYEISQQLKDYIPADDDEKNAKLCHLLGSICRGITTKNCEVENYFKKAIEIRERLAEKEPEKFNPDLATSYNNLGVFYNEQEQTDKAMVCYNNAIEIRKKLANTNPERFIADLATSYNDFGIFWNKQGKAEQTKYYFELALEIRKDLADRNPEIFDPVLASSYNNLAIFFRKHQQPEDAERYYNTAIEIREKLVNTNPDRYNRALAQSYHNMGILYASQRNKKNAETYFLKALKIDEKLAKEYPERFNPELAQSYDNIAIFYSQCQQPEETEKYYNCAIELREQLAKENPERFNHSLATSYDNIGVFYDDQKQPEKAKPYFENALKTREILAKENPERFNIDLARSYNSMGAFYDNQGQTETAAEFYSKAIAIYTALAKENPDRFNHEFALCYFNLATVLNDGPTFKKALDIARTCPQNTTCKNIMRIIQARGLC